MTIKHLFPPAWPALNLDFANSKSLDPRITFTRSSIGTYIDADGIVQTAVDDEPRFDHSGAGESLGLLIEESRTNTIVNSTDMPAIFTATELTATANAGTAPDGTNTAVRLEASANAIEHHYQCASGGGATRTYTVFAKADGETTVYLGNYFAISQGYDFDLTDDSEPSGGTSGSINYSYEQKNLANGWKRLSYTIDPYAARFSFIVMPGGNNKNAGTGGAVLIWGPMSEDATFPTSYIATAGATATRAADIANITGTNFSSWYNQGEGTLLAQWVSPDIKQFSSPAIIKSSTAKNDPRIYVYAYLGNQLRGLVKTPAESVTVLTSSYVPNTKLNTAIAYNASSQSSTFNGNTPQTANISTPIPTMVRMDLGDVYTTNDRYSNHHISRIAYYPTRLPDEQLEALTS